MLFSMIYSMENRADQEKVMKNDEYVLDKQRQELRHNIYRWRWLQ